MNRGNRYRRMYNLTGSPGWIRFGTSPRFSGRGIGRGPCAQYLEKTGQMDDFLKDISTSSSVERTWPGFFGYDQETSSKYQKEQLTKRIYDLEEELKELKTKLKN